MKRRARTMTDSNHKFDEPLEGISYRQYLRDAYAGQIQFIRELEGILGKKRTHEIVEKYYTQQSIEGCKKLVENQDEPIKSIEDVKNLFERLKENPFAQKTQTDEFLESEPSSLKFCTKECLYADVFKDFNAGDLGELMLCNGDFATAEIFHPNLRLERTKTIMAGDEFCGFVYYWDE